MGNFYGKGLEFELARKGQEGHRAIITTKAKRAYMDELHVSISIY
jgi:hypothetical protein